MTKLIPENKVFLISIWKSRLIHCFCMTVLQLYVKLKIAAASHRQNETRLTRALFIFTLIKNPNYAKTYSRKRFRSGLTKKGN